MTEHAGTRWPATRDLLVGATWGMLAILLGCGVAWSFRLRANEADRILRDSTETLPDHAMRWFSLDVPRNGVVDLEAHTGGGERFTLYLAHRAKTIAGYQPDFRLIKTFSAEGVSAVHTCRELPRGEYNLVFLRPPTSETPGKEATLQLRVRFRSQRRLRCARGRRRVRRAVRVFSARGRRIVCVAWLMFATAWPGLAASEATSDERDTLVFKDGDRVQGVVISRSTELIVFRSDRFGEVRVSAADAVVIPGEKPPADEAKAMAAKIDAPLPPNAAERAEEERVSRWERFSLSVLTAKLRDAFGPWNGRLAFALEDVVDSTQRSSSSVEAALRRKWSRDDLQFRVRYDYAETNTARTTDIVRASGSWRRDFNKTYFAHYRPSAEWNRASKRQGVPNDYSLLQQEIGAGFQLLTTASRKVRAGISHNRFDTWNSAPVADHVATSAQSAFEEIELKLPWAIGISQRGVWYPVPDKRDGWDNRIELNKRFTETLSIAFRHEIRRHNPDGSAQDFNKTKLLLGFDF